MSLFQKFMKWANDSISDRDRLCWYSNTGRLDEFGQVLDFYYFQEGRELTLDDGSVIKVIDNGGRSSYENSDEIPFIVSYKGKYFGKFGRYNSWDEDFWDNNEFEEVEYQTKEIIVTKTVSGWFKVDGDDNEE